MRNCLHFSYCSSYNHSGHWGAPRWEWDPRSSPPPYWVSDQPASDGTRGQRGMWDFCWLHLVRNLQTAENTLAFLHLRIVKIFQKFYKGSTRGEKIRPKNLAARRAEILGEFSNEGRIPSKPNARFHVGGSISDCTRGWHLKWGKSAKF